MFSLDAPLQPAVEGFVDPENGESQHSTHLNNVIMQIHRNTSIQDLITLLGPQLTHVQDKRRSRATLLLAEVLTRLPELKLTPETTHLLLFFFVERLSDTPSLGPCLKALSALLLFHAAAVPAADILLLLESLFSLPSPIPTLGQAMRKQCFELMSIVLRLNVVDAHGPRVLMEGFLAAMDGEKDPRNLLLCLQLASSLLAAFPSHVDRDLALLFFNITSCYFPITFKPPPNDPYGITSAQLVAALRNVFVGHDLMAKHVVPMVLDKLSRTTVTDMTIDMLDTLAFCCTKYPLNRLLTQFQPVATAVYHHVLHGDNQGVIAAATATLRTIAKVVSPPSSLPGMQALAWNKFVVHVVQTALRDMQDQAMDSMVSLRAATVLTGVAAQSAAGLAFVLESSLPFLLSRVEAAKTAITSSCSSSCCSTPSSSQLEAALACIVGLLDCIDVDVDHVTPPILAHVESILTALVESFHFASTQLAATSTSSRPQRLCLQGLAKIVLRPPSPVLHEPSVHSLVDLWTTIVLTHPAADVRAEATAALKSTAIKSTVLAHYVRARCLPPLMQVVEFPQACASSQRSVDDAHKDVLAVMLELSTEPSMFMALVLPMSQLALGVTSHGAALHMHPYAKDIVAAVASIVRQNQSNVQCVDACVLPTDSTITPLVQLLVDSVVHNVRQQHDVSVGDAVSAALVPPTATILGVVMQHGSSQAQETLLQYVLSLFLAAHASEAALQLMPLLGAVLYSSGAALATIAPSLPTLVPLLLELAQGVATSAVQHAARTCALKSIASLFNAMPDDALLQHYLDHVTSNKRPTDQQADPVAAVVHDADQPIDRRLSALQLYLHVTKAIVLRGHATYVPIVFNFLWALLSVDELKIHVAQGFHLIVQDFPDVLGSVNHAIISPVHRQRSFSLLFPLLSSKEGMNMEKRVVTLLVVAHTPHAILLPHVHDILPLAVDALNQKEQPYAALVGHPALVTFEMCFEHDPQLVYGYLNQVFPGLLWQAEHCVAVKDRVAALACLSGLAKSKYELIHPHKERVIKGLLGPLDDRKRTVRQAAVKVRNEWSIL
ncbi:hypothetical protein H310_11209 [Aphanomyces invadans]|uniref:MMS19 nucleotide excision repair protein n=1 Tax=Aphanomyces invadans TaxID=157072 RepID=A0A024TNW2_9STRA|nr:hypothetical protein H310_11209 [Aphanomyces invadans]ETV95311.1 hypothetical protein H310_11209 [Aphanomyces invadans]|eukprot:XP_008876012.1 hypothetical protein H310_11209 [Aphanomyces invadans]